jgi:hypothetical protein
MLLQAPSLPLSLQVCNDQRAAVLVTRETQDEAAQFWAEHAMHPLRGRDLILASICPQVYIGSIVTEYVTLAL